MEKKFYQMTPAERMDSLNLSRSARSNLEKMALDSEIANNLIENQISEFEIPMGIAQNFVINDRPVFIPMVTEEPSVIAAASNGARIAGSFKATMNERLMRGQIVFYDVTDPSSLTKAILERQTEIFLQAEQSYPSIVKRGGGLRKIETRIFEQNFVSVDFHVDVKDAMGANIINAILEGITSLFHLWFPQTHTLFSILSNLATESLVTAKCKIPVKALSKGEDGAEIAQKIALASVFSKLDPYRAATHNKGIMNGVEAVVLATGNDSRAVNAGAHAFAAIKGRYEGLATWEVKNNNLIGELTLPLPVATVGGGTKVLPKAQAALEILGVTKAEELAKIIVSVGLAQNLAALRALVSEGIQRGHMSLQARSLAMSVGATNEEIPLLTERLRHEKIMNQEIAKQNLADLRK